jgi:hypothetical protein
MGINWIAGQMRWQPHLGRDGAQYSLAHLYPFNLTVHFEALRGRPARTVQVSIGFSLHVFTCDICDAGPNPELYSDNRETRAFSRERYARSHRLRSIVEELENRRCYFTGQLNYFTFDLEGLPPGQEYRVYFDVQRRARNEVQLFVQSAYVVQRDELPDGRRHKSVRFRVIVSEALLGKKPKEPL